MAAVLSAAEIQAMRDYLTEFPPLAAPPPDLPFLDLLRIVATLSHLQSERDHVNALFAALSADYQTLQEKAMAIEASRDCLQTQAVRRLASEVRDLADEVDALKRRLPQEDQSR